MRACFDGAIFSVCLFIAALVRYDFSFSRPSYTGILTASVIGFAVIVILGMLAVYRGKFWRASGDELVAVGSLNAIAAGLIYLLMLPPVRLWLVPVSVPITAALMSVAAVGLILWLQGSIARRQRMSRRENIRSVIIGAGRHGRTALRMITEDPNNVYAAVGLLDDDPTKRNLRVDGVRVLGTIDSIGDVLDRTEAQMVVIASRSLPSARIDLIVREASKRNVALSMLPHFTEEDIRRQAASSEGKLKPRLGSFRDLEFDDLIGRPAIDTDLDSIAGYLAGKTVLVTGAGGSIGSALCKELSRFSTKRVVMTDRDESGLHSTQLIIEGKALLTSENLVLGDLRDRAFVMQLISEVQPDIIFHAAALKHLTFLERFPAEAIQTNVGASLDLLQAAVENGVERFVHISTDKAADPSSVLGASKYLTERAVAQVARETGRRYMSVRFGNVLGSRGSVLGTFVAQAQAGGPITVTEPGVKRYFMAASEACELVLQAGALGKPGETLVLDMGEPVLIEDLARRVASLTGHGDVEIVYTGLREGEKHEERRLGHGEVDHRPGHPLISQVKIPPVALSGVVELVSISRRAGHAHGTKLAERLKSLIQVERASDYVLKPAAAEEQAMSMQTQPHQIVFGPLLGGEA